MSSLAEAIQRHRNRLPAMEREPASPRQDANAGSPTLAVTKWEPVIRNSLRGFCSVTSRTGLTMHRVAINVTHGRPWASPPARATGLKDEREKTVWDPLFTFASREQRDEWSAKVIEALVAAHPRALDPPELSE